FYFLEMNTRLQVEHPVTELVAGVDLIEEMIRSAYGLPLRLTQRDVTLKGWAIESRVYAEDPMRGFLPSTGRLTTYRPPNEGVAAGVTLRNDTGVSEGSEISIHYDPLIAKLVTHAGDRAGAIEAQAEALEVYVIDGVRHNIPFLAALMQHERWRAGRLSTGFIAEEYPDGFKPLAASGESEDTLVAIAAHIDHVCELRRRAISGQLRDPALGRLDQKRIVTLGNAQIAIEIDPDAEELGVLFTDGRRLRVASSWVPGDRVWRGEIDGRRKTAQVKPILNGFALSHCGVGVEARVYSKREAALAALMIARQSSGRSSALLCPMPGLVKSIAVREGQEVRLGEALCVVEAMKMENLLVAERDATVKTILAKPGESLAVDAVIMEFA
ncbi:MAG: acetyl/propionyl-CoA carboxylase subunit alpha, partial [Bradyrhizobium sp.]